MGSLKEMGISPRTFADKASSWEGWPVAGRVIVILTLCFFFPWRVQPSSNASRVFLKKPKVSTSSFKLGDIMGEVRLFVYCHPVNL
jgi:hypothetical protein